MGEAGTATNYMYTASTATDIYVLAYLAGLPAEMTDDPRIRATFFESFWRGFANGVKRSLEDKGFKAELSAQPPRKITIGGFEAQEQEFSVGKMPGTVRAVIAGGYAYSALVISLGEAPGDDYRRFVNSFNLRARR